MYRPRAFAIDDAAALHSFIRAHPFATIAAPIDGRVHFAYAPVVIDGDGPGNARFHVALRNPFAALPDGTRLSFSFMGLHAYISPDWYRSEGMVPTWNYMAVEGMGIARRLTGDGLRQLLVDLSAAEEERLLPKRPWTLDKVPEPRSAALMGAIVGFAVPFETLEGKFKLSQDKNADDFDGAIAGLEARGDAASLSVAAAMRKRGRA